MGAVRVLCQDHVSVGGSSRGDERGGKDRARTYAVGAHRGLLVRGGTQRAIGGGLTWCHRIL